MGQFLFSACEVGPPSYLPQFVAKVSIFKHFVVTCILYYVKSETFGNFWLGTVLIALHNCYDYYTPGSSCLGGIIHK